MMAMPKQVTPIIKLKLNPKIKFLPSEVSDRVTVHDPDSHPVTHIGQIHLPPEEFKNL